MRFLTLLAVLLLAACNNSGSGSGPANELPLNLPEIY